LPAIVSKTYETYLIMNEQDKQLLLVDLCARLPYDTIVSVDNGKYREDTKLRTYHLADFNTWDVRPYLRPINTITKSEIANAIKYICDTDNVVWDNGTHGVGFYFYKSDGIKRPFDDFKFRLGCYGPKNIDWFNKFHFDYRGLIERELAIEAPEGTYDF